jgi:hypothetical protein
MSDLVTVRSCATREEAEFLKGLLEASGIHALIAADEYIGLPLMVSGGVKLQVLQENAEKAAQILDAADAQGEEPFEGDEDFGDESDPDADSDGSDESE